MILVTKHTYLSQPSGSNRRKLPNSHHGGSWLRQPFNSGQEDKKTLQDILVHYPDAEKLLMKKARYHLVNPNGEESVLFCNIQEKNYMVIAVISFFHDTHLTTAVQLCMENFTD